VLSGRGPCDELITRPEEPYRLLCIVLCDLETSCMRKIWRTGGGLLRQKRGGGIIIVIESLISVKFIFFACKKCMNSTQNGIIGVKC